MFGLVLEVLAHHRVRTKLVCTLTRNKLSGRATADAFAGVARLAGVLPPRRTPRRGTVWKQPRVVERLVTTMPPTNLLRDSRNDLAGLAPEKSSCGDLFV